jgi:multiple sugar transport system permease protein
MKPGVISRVAANVAGVALAMLFLLPMLWFIFAPFNERATLAVKVPDQFSLANFNTVLSNEMAVRSLLQNSVIIAGGVMILTALLATLAAYGFARGTIPGRGVVTYILLLFSSVVTGTASLVPIFVLVYNLGMFNTFQGVILVIVGGALPTSIFIMMDFIKGLPRSYEEAAMVSGASSLQILKDVVFPVLRPGILVIAVLAFVNGWSAFLTPLILIRNANMRPASIAFYQFYSEEGSPNIPLISAYAVLYTVPVLLLYLLINARYGFRFFGGIKQ